MSVAPLLTAGVSDEVAQELQMPMGPQMLEDVEKPMPARPATLRDPGTPDRIVMEQHSVPQLKFDYGCMGDGGPLQIAFSLVGADTSSGSIHETMVPDSKKMDMPYVVAATAKGVRDLVNGRFCLHRDKEGVLQLSLDKSGKRMSS